ncbi:PREDICTED: G-protein-signaling modulator 2-like [Acropora digitifera]|uniref:G-protein-signaling modulator 2-like n=1 Tax=Acropora digitifera TaxID=70779 RepID=UPI00077A27BB|nr:PREDICTED: G-protein-signaling modulator 2-like [Acropora digitifera]
MDDKAGKEKASNNRGTDFHSRGELGKAIERLEKDLEIAIEIADQAREGNAYGNIGNTYRLLGGEGTAYGNIGNAYHALADFQKAIEYHQRALATAIDIADREGEGLTYGNLGNACNSLGDFLKALDYHKKHLQIAREIGLRAGEGTAYGNLGYTYRSLVVSPKMFADDTSITVAAVSLTEVENKINLDLENLNRWLVANRLILRVTKTEFMVIGSHQRDRASGNQEINVEINGKSITRFHKVESLGLSINEHLTWKDHVDEIVRKYRRPLERLNE